MDGGRGGRVTFVEKHDNYYLNQVTKVNINSDVMFIVYLQSNVLKGQFTYVIFNSILTTGQVSTEGCSAKYLKDRKSVV